MSCDAVINLRQVNYRERHPKDTKQQGDRTTPSLQRIIALRKEIQTFSAEDLSRIIEMAWEDRTPFEAIEQNFGTSEGTVIQIMRSQLKPSSFKSWRKRVSRRKTKHLHLRVTGVSRGYCSTQYKYR